MIVVREAAAQVRCDDGWIVQGGERQRTLEVRTQELASAILSLSERQLHALVHPSTQVLSHHSLLAIFLS
jgi:hypothetical protein